MSSFPYHPFITFGVCTTSSNCYEYDLRGYAGIAICLEHLETIVVADEEDESLCPNAGSPIEGLLVCPERLHAQTFGCLVDVENQKLVFSLAGQQIGR
jgi:hypothetical protein